MSKPTDHKSKAPKVKEVDGGKRVTFPDLVEKDANGKAILVDEKPVPLSVTVEDEALDDFEFLDDMRALDVDGNSSKLPAVLRRVVGDDYAKTMNALRNEKGRVQIGPAVDFINSLLGAINPNS